MIAIISILFTVNLLLTTAIKRHFIVIIIAIITRDFTIADFSYNQKSMMGLGDFDHALHTEDVIQSQLVLTTNSCEPIKNNSKMIHKNNMI